MAKCIVIGGGFAGLSAAVLLSKNKHNVKLLEASPKLGGRAYSLKIPKHEDSIDNGQHILMGCYKNTLDFFEMIGSFDLLEFQKNLKIDFVERGGRSFLLKASSLFYPLNLLMAVLKYNAFGVRNRFRALSIFLSLPFINTKKINSLTVEDWLRKKNQNNSTIIKLWEIIAIGTLNTKPDKASASIFVEVLKKIFLSGNKASAIVLPVDGLSEVYCRQSEEFLNKNNSEVLLSEAVTGFEFDGEKISKIYTEKNTYNDFDFVISAIPHHSLSKLLTYKKFDEINKLHIEYSPILNIHLWLKDNPFAEKFYGLIDSKIHWIFNHQKHISLVTSSADELIDQSSEELVKIACKEIIEFFPTFNEDLVTDYKVIKEKRATFIPSIENTNFRKVLPNSYSNLVLAGDWTNTGLPSTIEGAVKSGLDAAGFVINNLN
jgi:squalene-associated FAD-dependent desaturase